MCFLLLEPTFHLHWLTAKSQYMCEGHHQGASWHSVALCHGYRHWDGKQGALPVFAIFWQLPACLRATRAKKARHIWAWRPGTVADIINSEVCESLGERGAEVPRGEEERLVRGQELRQQNERRQGTRMAPQWWGGQQCDSQLGAKVWVHWDQGAGDGVGCILAGWGDWDQIKEPGASGGGWGWGKRNRSDTKAWGGFLSTLKTFPKYVYIISHKKTLSAPWSFLFLPDSQTLLSWSPRPEHTISIACCCFPSLRPSKEATPLLSAG